MIPGSGRSPGARIGYPLQYSWASLVAQTVQNLPVMQETCVRSLGWEDPLEKGTVTHSSTLDWDSMGRGAWQATVHGVAKSWTRLSYFTFTHISGLPWWLRQYRICLKCRRPGFDPWVGTFPGEKHGNPLQYSCLERPHGQSSLAGCSP